MSLSRFGEVKRSMKLCHNNSCAKKGQEGYNPAYKFDLIYKCMVHNTNALTKYADENQTIDETTWGHGGYGEPGSGITGRLRGKKVPKGGQTVLISDAHRFRPHAYIHRHKLHVKQDGMTRGGCVELHNLLTQYKDMIITPSSQPTNHPSATSSSIISSTSSSTNNKKEIKKIFKTHPTVIADNYFTDDKMQNWIGENKFGCIATTARNFLPKDIPKVHLHHLKSTPGCKKSKVARFTQPIVAVKSYPTYERAHISFQSTSSTNITTTNALNTCKLFVEIRERGRGESKRHWAIEMNEARRLYLWLYCRIDIADHLIKNANIFYRTWKYWHAAKNHCIAAVIVVAYGIYEECGEGKLNEEWKFKDKKEKMTYWDFRDKLADGLLTYSPTRIKYSGDSFMRAVTSTPKNKRGTKRSVSGVSAAQYGKARKWTTSRLCGDLGKITHHVRSIVPVPTKKPRVCAWCGLPCYFMCGMCKDETGKHIPLHYNQKKGDAKGNQCFYHYHNDMMFGLGKNDHTRLRNGTKSEWKPATSAEIRKNAEHIRSLQL